MRDTRAGRPGRPNPPRVLFAAGAVSLVGIVLCFLMGHEYYLLPAPERPLHACHAALRPSGTSGLLFGVAGTALMLLNLTYVVRKRRTGAPWLGSLRSWMAFHILTGVTGPALILLHTAFLPSSALGILSLSAMLVAVLTGVVGRYIYAHVPRSIEGSELELEAARKRLDEYRIQLERLGVRMAVPGNGGAASRASQGGILAALGSLVRGDRQGHADYRRLRTAILTSRALRPHGRRILPLARTLTRERQRVARHKDLRFLMGSWRFFHRWLAVVMLLVVGFHIALAFVYGDLWILRWRR